MCVCVCVSKAHTYTSIYRFSYMFILTLETKRQRKGGRGRCKKYIDLRRLMMSPLDFNEDSLLSSMKQYVGACLMNPC